MIYPEFCRNWQRCERHEGTVHMDAASPHTLHAEQLQGCSELSCLPWLGFPLVLSWEAVQGEGGILERTFDEVKDIFSCVSLWLWLTVSMTGEESSHYGEAVGWEGKVGGRPASLQGDSRPSFTGRTCRTTAVEPLVKTCKGNGLSKRKTSWKCLKDECLPSGPCWRQGGCFKMHLEMFFREGACACSVFWLRSEPVCEHLSCKAVTSLFHQGWNARDACPTCTHITDLSSCVFSLPAYHSSTEMYFCPVLYWLSTVWSDAEGFHEKSKEVLKAK